MVMLAGLVVNNRFFPERAHKSVISYVVRILPAAPWLYRLAWLLITTGSYLKEHMKVWLAK